MSKRRVTKEMEVIGADGVHIGAADRVNGDRIRLAKSDCSGSQSQNVAMATGHPT
jgi:hypothetical protein